ncbi:putative phospholipase D/Transphosphatidylase, CDP-alcohol phosphatidyltransferase class-II family [Septoria linicola]|nr:putative phospholipase D/Transphosphatidylase, CDP-alcohol phosphatidyltransferase class-II family [Septoria linicola]
MLMRRVFPCLRATKVRAANNGSQNGSLRRHFSSTSSMPAAATPASAQSSASQLAVFTGELDKISPRFDISADAIEVLKSPTEFYETLKAKIRNAKRRIYLSTLYIGKSEHEFIDTIRQALKSNPDLKVSLLTDYLRGTREAPNPSCASLLASLVEEFGPDRVEVRLYHTPNLTGARKAVLPKRINEGWGLQHMKLYGIDDEIIMSGANLSDDYFTNRQDRYHVFRSKLITDYFSDLYRTICDLSYRVLPAGKDAGGFIAEWPQANIQPEPLKDPQGYIKAATRVLQPLAAPPSARTSQPDTDTSVYPLVQLTPLLKPDTSTELPALTGILRTLGTSEFSGSKWTFTAGYFNMTPEVRELLLKTRPASGTVVAASPWANGFYGSKGVSGMLPAAYSLLGRRFLDAVSKAGLSKQIAVKEWRKGTVNTPGGWTYHAKGIWVTLPNEQDPSISLIGSSNYTKRSYSLDIEANTLIVTRNSDLQRRLGEEQKWLQEYASPMTHDDYAKTERRVGLHVRLAMWIVTLVGGAL